MNTTKRLAADAMLAAMFVCLSLVSISLPNMKITLDSLPVLVAAFLFGPLDGLAVGLTGSFLNQMLTYGFTATTLLWILPAGLRGLLVGLYAKKHSFELTQKQTIFIVVLSALAVTALNTVIMAVDSLIYGYYSTAYVFGALVFRIIAGVLTAVVFSLIIPPLIKQLKKYVNLS